VIHDTSSVKIEIDKLKAKICGYKTQLEVLTERLSDLPSSVSPTLIFNQMEKITKLKQEEESRLEGLNSLKRPLYSSQPS